MSGADHIRRVIRCRLHRMGLGILRSVIPFDAWHANSPYSCRPYKKVVVDIVNSLQPDTVVEVGCGLGDILSRVRARERFGFDIDSAAIRAARLLHPGRVRWIVEEAATIGRHMPLGTRIGCLIMVNWIHNLRPEQLAACVLPLLPRTDYLLLDSIVPHAPPSYRYHHQFEFLSGVAKSVSRASVPGEPREFVLYKVR